MAIFLVQHGISASKDDNSEKELTDQGRIDTERIAKVAKEYGIMVEKIVHSGKTRAKQTATLYHNILSVKTPLEAVSGINPQDDVRVFAEYLNPGAALMVVGHMPFMQRLLSYLITRSEEKKVYQFQNSGIVCLDASKGTDGKLEWFIKWTLNPKIS
jgi:phosphohistidine phosphatase